MGYRDIKMWDLILNKYSRFEKERSLRLMLNVPYIFPWAILWSIHSGLCKTNKCNGSQTVLLG